MRDPQKRLTDATKEFCAAIEYAERQGMTVDVNLNWKPGLTPMMQFVKCRTAEIWLNGVLIEVEP